MVAHTSSDSGLVPTSLGRLNVRQAGVGPPALLWHACGSTPAAGVR